MNVGVIGSGSIGPDLAYGFASALSRTKGAKVYLHDIRQEALEQGMERIRGYLKKGVARGKLSPKAAASIEESLIPTLNLEDLADCTYVLEAASEDLQVKQAILAKLEDVVSPSCLIGFATSGIPRARIAAKVKHPERCFVNHPFFPAWRSLPIEVVASGDADKTAEMIATLKTLGKVPIMTADVPCFAADDIFCNYISEAVRIVEDGIATPAQVDRVVNESIGGGGPFAVMDGTRGNLLTAHCQELMRDADTGSEWFAPPALLIKQGNTPWHDRRTPQDAGPVAKETERRIMNRILAVLLGRTYFVVDHQICDAADLNWLTRMALGFKKGLLEIAQDLGPEQVYMITQSYADAHAGFEVPTSIRERNLPTFRINVKVERKEGIGIVRVNRPEVKNALSAQTIAEIDSAFEELGADESVRGIIFTSYDGALAGADITELAALKTPDACRAICLKAYEVLNRISAMKKPVVAALDGPVLGGGAEFSMACHARVVGPGLLLGQPEVNLGIIPGYGGTQRLPRLVGFEHAARMIRTGAPVGAKEACAIGWAHGDPTADVEGAARALIDAHLAGTTPIRPVDPSPLEGPFDFPSVDLGHHSLAIDAIVVEVMRKGLALPLAEGLLVEADGFAQCKQTVDLDIGMKNFMANGPRVPALFLNE